MTTKEKRDMILSLFINEKEIYEFVENMNPERFVEIHQDNFKNHYLKEPPINFEDADFLYDVIGEKYIQFFKNKGVDASYRWLNPCFGLPGTMSENWIKSLLHEDYTMDEVQCIITDDSWTDELHEKFNELCWDMVSGYSYSCYVYDILNEYQNNFGISLGINDY